MSSSSSTYSHIIPKGCCIMSVLVSILQRKRSNRIYTDIGEGIYGGNWLTRFWRLRSSTICHLHAGDPRKAHSIWVQTPENQESQWYNSLSSAKDQEPGASPSEDKKTQVFQPKMKEQIRPFSFFSSSCPNGLDDACPCGWGQIFLVYDSISSITWKHLPETPRSNVHSYLGTLNPVKLTPNINHHKVLSRRGIRTWSHGSGLQTGKGGSGSNPGGKAADGNWSNPSAADPSPGTATSSRENSGSTYSIPSPETAVIH